MIDLVFNNFTKDRKYGKDFFQKIVAAAVNKTGLRSKNVELSINLVGNERIRSLNKKYRKKDKTTDVLSFPLETGTDVKLSKNDILSLGDIFICLPVAKKNAIHENVNLDYLVSFLIVHGFLHLIGYDHEKSLIAKKEMFTIQGKILNSCTNKLLPA